MADKPQSPFSGLDKALLRSTRAHGVQPASQQASEPASQQTSKPVSQLADKLVSQQASKPAQQMVKATFYLTPENIMQLEQLRLARMQKGEKVDKSALVREAIEKITSMTA